MNAVKLLYLVVVQGGVPRLVAEPCVLEGEGLRRYGTQEALLRTAALAEPAVAIAVGDALFAEGDRRMVSGRVPFDNESATVVIVTPDSSVPPEELANPLRWLAEALLHEQVTLTAPRPAAPLAVGQASPGPVGHTAPQPLGALFYGSVVVALLVGLAAGFVGRGDGGQRATSAVRMPGAQGGPSIGAAARAAPPHGDEPAPASAKAAPGPGNDDEGAAEAAEGVEGVEGAEGVEGELGGAALDDAAEGSGGQAPPGPAAAPADRPARRPDPAKAVAADDGGPDGFAALAKLPPVSLWGGLPLPRGVEGRCNRFGDVELSAKQGGKSLKRVVVCGLFRKSSRRDKAPLVRTRVCVPGPARCVAVKGAAQTTLPRVVCTPKSGRAYPLRVKRGRVPAGYRSGPGVTAAQEAACGGRAAAYNSALAKLRKLAR